VLPDGIDTIAEIVEDVTFLGSVAGGKESADDALDVVPDKSDVYCHITSFF
jgi:hypothetical protein